MAEAYTDARLAREHRLVDLVNQLRELAETELPGTYSSDGILGAACTLYAAEQLLGNAMVAGGVEIVAPGASEEVENDHAG